MFSPMLDALGPIKTKIIKTTNKIQQSVDYSYDPKSNVVKSM